MRYPPSDKTEIIRLVEQSLHGRAKILCLEGFGRSAAESARSHRQPGLHRHQGGRGIQGQDHGPEPALADRLHLPQGHGLGLVLDDFSRFIVAWKLCATMKAQDVTAALDLALAASGLDQMTVVHRPRLLSDNGSS
jgi:transposase InsO family protein